jgi:hypothetical protein
METYNLDLEFLDDQKSKLPFNPIARIYVKTFTRASADGPPLITPNCVTIRELEYQIDQIESELEAIRKKRERSSLRMMRGNTRERVLVVDGTSSRGSRFGSRCGPAKRPASGCQMSTGGVGEARGGDGRQLLDPVQQFAEERRCLFAGIAVANRIQRDEVEVSGVEPHFSRHPPLHVEYKNCRHQQQRQRPRHLVHHQDIAEAQTAVAAQPDVAAFLEGGSEISSRGLQSRCEAKGEAGRGLGEAA